MQECIKSDACEKTKEELKKNIQIYSKMLCYKQLARNIWEINFVIISYKVWTIGKSK